MASFALLAIKVSPADQRRSTAERLLANCDPLCRMTVLEELANDAFSRVGEREPVWLANQGLVALEMLVAESDRLPEDYTERTLNSASALVGKLTPEHLVPPREAEPQNVKHIVTRWRAWLERFGELPVFKQAGKRARGEARVGTPPRNGLALQADRAR